MSLTFLSPLLLIGCLSAAIPLIIHLSRSRKTKKIRFSTTRFLTDQFLRSYRMNRLKELMLLAVRMALFALFAIAIARPLFRAPGDLFGQQRAVVIVLDDSASMMLREEEQGPTLFDKAKIAAAELIDGLDEDDSVSIVLASRRGKGATALFSKPTSEHAEVRQALDRVEVATLGTDVQQALTRAEGMIGSSPAPSKEIYVISDLQQTGFQRNDESSKTGSEIQTFFVAIRPTKVRNLSVTAVQYAAARPMVGIPFSIRPHVHNHSDESTACEVELYVDGKKVGQRRIDKLQPNRWSVPRFHFTFDRPGWHHGYVQVRDPFLTTDNKRYFAFEVLDSIKVLAVNGAPSAVTRLDELFFLRLAFSASKNIQSPIHIESISPDNLSGKKLADYQLVVLANVESCSGPVVESLEKYVDQGGSILAFLGDKTNATFHNQTFVGTNRLHGGLMPGRLMQIEGNPSPNNQKHPGRVGEIDDNHPVLAAMANGELGNLTKIRFKAWWGIDPGESRILMRTDSGAPLLCEKSFGKGNVIMFACPCDRDWSNFPVRPVFLPWVYRLVSYLAQEPLARDSFFKTGDAVPVASSATSAATQMLVKKPDGQTGNVGSSNDPAAPFQFAETHSAGVYRIYPPGQSNKGQLFVANVDSYESDLTSLVDALGERQTEQEYKNMDDKILAGLKQLMPDRPLVSYVGDPSKVSQVSAAARRGFELWNLVLIAALLFALFEPWLANRISLAQYLKTTRDYRTTSIVSTQSNSNAPIRPTTRPAERELEEANT